MPNSASSGRAKPARWRSVGGVPWPRPWVLAAFGVLLILLMLLVDRPLSEALREAGPGVAGFFRFFSDWGNAKWYLWPLGLGAIFCWLRRKSRPDRHAAESYGWAAGALLFLFVAIAFSGIVTNLFKILFGRARPKLLDQADLYGFFPPGLEGVFHSFPSGHANTGFALAVGVALIWPRSRYWMLALATVIAGARVGTNKHFLSDILGGAALAAVTTFWLRERFARVGICFEHDAKGRPRLRRRGRLLRRQLRGRLGALTSPGA